jgi:hypothetical protein
MRRMKRLRRQRARRIPALVASLALFLLGSNYCVLGVLSGDTGMVCMSMPSDASSAAVPACHRAVPATDSGSEKPAAMPSCCPDPVVAPASPVVEKADAAFTPLADDAIAALVSVAAPASLQWHGHRPAPDTRSPTRLARAPVPARAPPLA